MSDMTATFKLYLCSSLSCLAF